MAHLGNFTQNSSCSGFIISNGNESVTQVPLPIPTFSYSMETVPLGIDGRHLHAHYVWDRNYETPWAKMSRPIQARIRATGKFRTCLLFFVTSTLLRDEDFKNAVADLQTKSVIISSRGSIAFAGCGAFSRSFDAITESLAEQLFDRAGMCDLKGKIFKVSLR